MLAYPKTSAFADSPRRSRLTLVLHIERLALCGRYLALVLIVGIALAGRASGGALAVTILAAVLGAHNLFTHWLLATRNLRMFWSPINFLAHFLSMALLAQWPLFGAMQLSALLYLFLMGFGMYTRSLRWTLFAASLCCLAQAAGQVLRGETLPHMATAMTCVGFLACGWLVGIATRAVARVEHNLSKRAQALMASEAKLRTILDSTGVPLLVFNGEERITEANEKAYDFFGLKREGLLGESIRSFIFDDGALPEKMATLRDQGEYHGQEIFIDENDEECNITVWMRAFILNSRPYYVAAFHDVTKQKHVEEATNLANVQLDRANKELAQVSKLKTRFLDDISRNLRTPLATLQGYTELLLNDDFGGLAHDQRQALQVCRRNIQKAFAVLDETPKPDLAQIEEKQTTNCPASGDAPNGNEEGDSLNPS